MSGLRLWQTGGLRARQIGARVAVERREQREVVRRQAAQTPGLHRAHERVELVPLALAARREGALGELRHHRHEPGVLDEGGASRRPALAARS